MIARLILLHGLASAPTEFALLRRLLRQRRLDLVCVEIPGYTNANPDSDGPAAGGPDADAWVERCRTELRRHARGAGGPVIAGGLCTGSLIVAEALRQEPSLADGLLMMSPCFRADGWGLPRWYFARHLSYLSGTASRFRMNEREPYGLKDERVRQWVRMQMAQTARSASGPSSIRLDYVQHSEALAARARRGLAQWRKPLQIIHAREDEITRVDTVEKLVRRLSPTCRIFGEPGADAARTPSFARLRRFDIVEDSYHMITADGRREHVAALIAEFASDLAMSIEAAGRRSDGHAAAPTTGFRSEPQLVFDAATAR